MTVKVTVPADTAGPLAGLTVPFSTTEVFANVAVADCAVVVVLMLEAVTASVPLLVAKSLALVSAFTVNELEPPGVAAVVAIVNVAVFVLSLEVKETEFGEKDAVAPVGKTVVRERVAVKLPELPPPLPRLTVIV